MRFLIFALILVNSHVDGFKVEISQPRSSSELSCIPRPGAVLDPISDEMKQTFDSAALSNPRPVRHYAVSSSNSRTIDVPEIAKPRIDAISRRAVSMGGPVSPHVAVAHTPKNVETKTINESAKPIPLSNVPHKAISFKSTGDLEASQEGINTAPMAVPLNAIPRKAVSPCVPAADETKIGFRGRRNSAIEVMKKAFRFGRKE